MEEKLKEIAQKSGHRYETVLSNFQAIINDPVLTSDETMTKDDLYRYAIQVCIVRFLARAPVVEVEFVPVGFGSVFQDKNGVWNAEVMILTAQKELKRMLIRHNNLEWVMGVYNSIVPFGKYKTFLSKFFDDYAVDDRADFSKVEPTDIDIQKLPELLGIPMVPKLSEVPNYLSQRTDDGFVLRTDWKAVKGVVTRVQKVDRENKKLVVFDIIDDSLDLTPKVVEGKFYFPGFTIWTSPKFTVSPESEVLCIGSLSENSMNAYLVVTLHKPMGRV